MITLCLLLLLLFGYLDIFSCYVCVVDGLSPPSLDGGRAQLEWVCQQKSCAVGHQFDPEGHQVGGEEPRHVDALGQVVVQLLRDVVDVPDKKCHDRHWINVFQLLILALFNYLCIRLTSS